MIHDMKSVYDTSLFFQAGKLAIERGWALNLGGGFHHCSADKGGGFCAYADITLCIKFVFEHYRHIEKVMIVDLDAHQVWTHYLLKFCLIFNYIGTLLSLRGAKFSNNLKSGT